MRLLALATAAAAGSIAAAAPQSPPPRPTYDLQVRLVQGDKLVAAPRLTAASGETANFVSKRDGDGWALKLTASRGEDPLNVLLAIDLDVASRKGAVHQAWSGTITARTGERMTLSTPGQGDAPPMRMEVSATPA